MLILKCTVEVNLPDVKTLPIPCPHVDGQTDINFLLCVCTFIPVAVKIFIIEIMYYKRKMIN